MNPPSRQMQTSKRDDDYISYTHISKIFRFSNDTRTSPLLVIIGQGFVGLREIYVYCQTCKRIFGTVPIALRSLQDVNALALLVVLHGVGL